MPLTPEQIKELYTKPAKPRDERGALLKTSAQGAAGATKAKFLRIERQYPRLPEDGNVRQVSDTKRCASRGCSSATHFTHKGIPYCMIHMIYYLAIENTEFTRQNNANCDKSQEGTENGIGIDYATRLASGQNTL